MRIISGTVRAVSWLESCQSQDGSWGETCHTYEAPVYRGFGPSTASQTAWALKESSPQGIVAVACHKELEEGICGVKELADNDGLMPPIVVVPLTTDGCVDTEVNEEQALQVIASGCSLEPARGRIK